MAHQTDYEASPSVQMLTDGLRILNESLREMSVPEALRFGEKYRAIAGPILSLSEYHDNWIEKGHDILQLIHKLHYAYNETDTSTWRMRHDLATDYPGIDLAIMKLFGAMPMLEGIVQ